MEHLIVQYLKKYKQCPLPHVGTLEFTYQSAFISTDQQLIPPGRAIVNLQTHSSSAEGLLSYLSYMTGLTLEEVGETLEDYCQSLVSLKPMEELSLAYLGHFFINAQGQLEFRALPIPASYQKPISLNKLTKQIEAAPSIEQNGTMSAEQKVVAPKKKFKKSLWWIWALAFILSSIGVIFYYFNQRSDESIFGNSMKVKVENAPQTYQTIP